MSCSVGLLCSLCSACSSKLQPLALRSLVLEVRKGWTRGGGLRQHQAPSPPSSQKHQRSGRKTVEARVSLGEPRNCTDEPGVAPPTYLVLFMCIDKCDLYLLLIVGWGRQRQETWFTFLKQANPSMRDQLHEWITLQNLWRPVGTAVSVRPPPSWPAIVCCSVDTKESSYPKLPSCNASLRHTAVPVRLTAWRRAFAGWASAGRAPPKGSAMECWKYVVSGKYVKTGCTCRCSVG